MNAMPSRIYFPILCLENYAASFAYRDEICQCYVKLVPATNTAHAGYVFKIYLKTGHNNIITT